MSEERNPPSAFFQGLLAASVVLFLASLPWTSFRVDGSREGLPGWMVLLIGCLGLFDPGHPAHLAWLANPLLLLTWGMGMARTGIGTRRAAVAAGGLALLLALSFPLLRTVIVGDTGPSQVTGLGVGYWLWLASLGCGFAADVVRWKTGAALEREPIHA